MSQYLYIIETARRFLKIGISSRLNQRIKQIQASCPTPINVVSSFKLKYPLQVEKLAHDNFSEYAVHGEWFDVPVSEQQRIIDNITALVASESDVILKDTTHPAIIKFKSKLKTESFSERTIEAYALWLPQLLVFCGSTEFNNLSNKQLSEFINYLSQSKGLSSSSIKQASMAIKLFYKKTFEKDVDIDFKLEWKSNNYEEFKVYSKDEISMLLEALEQETYLIVLLLYGSGLRLMECLRLRIGHVLTDEQTINIYDAKGKLLRKTIIAKKTIPHLSNHIAKINNRATSYNALNITQENDNLLSTPYLFPSKGHQLSIKNINASDTHVSPTSIQRQLKKAALSVHVPADAVPQRLRHSFGFHLIAANRCSDTVRKLMGLSSNEQILIYFRMAFKDNIPAVSPLDL